MQRYYSILLLSLLTLTLSAQAVESRLQWLQLSDTSRISLITCASGHAIYERFGHTAIRIEDPPQHLDVVYHYGVFDFDTDWFIAKFVSGATDYQLGRLPFQYFIAEYVERNSAVYAQELNLTRDERQQLFEALEQNYLPKNRFYRYNFIYDNCATRPLEIIATNCHSIPQFAYHLPHPMTYRDVIKECVGTNNWMRFGIDIVIGSEADHDIVWSNLISFPTYLRSIVSTGTFATESGTQPLVRTEKTVCNFPPLPPEDDGLLNPLFVFTLLFLVVALWTWLHRHRPYRPWFDTFFFAITGLMGNIIAFLMFFSAHPLIHDNYNMLWLCPLHLIFAFCVLNRSHWRLWRIYAWICVLSTMTAIVAFCAHIQVMQASFLPLMLIMLLRALNYVLKNTAPTPTAAFVKKP